MPKQAGSWENADFLMELSLALFQVASNGGALSAQAKSAVEDYLKAQGHDQSWESVRSPLSPLRSSPLLLFASTLLDPDVAVVMARTQMKWDASAHEAMLICIVKHCDLNANNMAKVLDEMKNRGYEFTENAFRSHEALLLAMIEEFRPNKEKVTAIVQRMSDLGFNYTFHAVKYSAVPNIPLSFLCFATVLYMTPLPSKLTTALLSSQHIQKLRKTRDTSALDGSAASGDGSKASTPRKATPRKTPASGRKRKGAVDDDADELGRDLKAEDEEGATTTPSKRIKSE
ncbi:hypothetical protein A9K55_000638 [Cordyceps militaris]|uniref:Uncharacterized protein n=1 Tax=Cordyceps militaris TaxID=73501 RepID=A0A2H4SV82_CORMI|nr:hypothetical protein A9K55_000638 [Cordyceps militaris]